MATLSCAGLMGEDGFHGEFSKTMGNLGHGYLITTDSPVGKRELSKLFEG